MIAPLHVAVLFDPDSQLASGLARELFDEFMGAPTRPGARIPVSYHPSRDGTPLPVDFAAAEHVLAVLLVDDVLATRAGGRGQAVDRWADWLVSQLAADPERQGPHAVLPVALGARAFDLDTTRLTETSFVRLDRFVTRVGMSVGERVALDAARKRELLFATSVAALRLLGNEGADAEDLRRAPIEVFVSHAKQDLSTGAVTEILAELAQGPVEGWYDAAKLDPGAQFSRLILDGIRRCAIVLAVVTDSFSAREWCRREVLEAKRARRPLFVVDDIRGGEVRMFPYLGNAPRVRWESGGAPSVITKTVLAALRHRHHIAVNRSRARTTDLVMGGAPELLTVQDIGAASGVLYPDPPLDVHEIRELEIRLGATVRVETPLERLASRTRNARVGVSMSVAPDARLYGGSVEHLALLAHDLNLLLLRSGCKIGYGGVLGAPELTGGGTDFTALLLDLMRGHVGPDKQGPRVVNYVGWPMYLGENRREFAQQYPEGTDFEWVPPPADLGVGSSALGVREGTRFRPDSPARKFAWARGMTAMRERMNDEMSARVVLGGKLSGYVSRYPGVLEECLLALRARRPVFLIGAFGGAARLLLDVLQGADRHELTSDWVRGDDNGIPRFPVYDEMRALYAKAGFEMKTPEELRSELVQLGASGLGSALHNGLDDLENIELGTTANPLRMVELILSGLERSAG
ncbi:MAG: TIR domain-containing protein [Planctomycetaceae bacterium]|nr:TIR domain-containing protein [Planctomycetaceae bacterium]